MSATIQRPPGTKAQAPRATPGAGVPWLLVVLLVLAVAIPAASDALDVYDRVTHWGKLIHAVEGGLVAAMAALLLLGYRDRVRLVLPTQLAALMSMAVGVTVGACWEIVDFVMDWVRSSDLQKSNLDTMTDMLWCDLASVVCALLAVRLYAHTISDRHQAALGAAADTVFTPLGHLLERHGKLMALLVLLAIAASIAGLWFTGRPVPGVPID